MEGIASKIKALLAKAESTGNEHESELFFSKAYELMDRYQIDLDHLDDDKLGEEDLLDRHGGVSGTAEWDFRLMFAVADYFGARALQTRKAGRACVTLVGRQSARIVTAEMHAYLVRTVKRLGKENHTKMYENDDTHLSVSSATRRIGHALRYRIREMCNMRDAEGVSNMVNAPHTTNARNALVALNEVDAYIENKWPDMDTFKSTGATVNTVSKELASGINLNLQAGQNKVLRLE